MNKDFPIVFAACPYCECPDTVCGKACEDEPSIPKGTFVSLEKVFSPITDVSKITTPTVKGILHHYDVCYSCGLRRCTRAEIVSAPVTMKQMPHSPGGFPFQGS